MPERKLVPKPWRGAVVYLIIASLVNLGLPTPLKAEDGSGNHGQSPRSQSGRTPPTKKVRVPTVTGAALAGAGGLVMALGAWMVLHGEERLQLIGGKRGFERPWYYKHYPYRGAGYGVYGLGCVIALSSLAAKRTVLEVSPAVLDFGEVGIGTSQDRALTIANRGKRPLQVTSVRLEGDPSFSVDPLALPLMVPPMSQIELRVGIQPVSATDSWGKMRVALLFPHNNRKRTVDVALRGKGHKAPEPKLNTVSYDAAPLPH